MIPLVKLVFSFVVVLVVSFLLLALSGVMEPNPAHLGFFWD